MTRVLIVDDEIYAVKGLVSGVRWDSIGVEGVFEAYHAAMAKEVLRREEIDIMICDIEMPEASGLELMEWAAEQCLPIETIVLTCHSEFAYAQKALQLGGNDYLLKPVIYSDLERVLEKTIRKVREKRKASELGDLYLQYAELWNSRKPLLIERFWEDLLERRFRPDRESIDAALAGCDISYKDIERIRLVLISLEQWEKPLTEREEEIMEYALRKAAEELLPILPSGHVFRDRRGHTIAVVPVGDDERLGLSALCKSYIEACRRYFYGRVSCYVGEPVAIEEAIRSYLSLQNAEYRNVSRMNAVIELGEEPLDAEFPSSSQPSMLELADLLEQGKRAELMAALEEKLGQEALSVEALTAMYHSLLQVVYYALHRKGFSAALLYENESWLDAKQAAKSVGRFRSWAEKVVEAADRLLSAQASSSPVVQKVKAIVAERLNEELTREELAAGVFLNPAYLSRLFRKETGMALTEYILQEKMRRASDLLATTERSVSEIAGELGYGNFSYFARQFRKVYGETPHDYRKLLKRAK
ncbi:response regulator transcription factor [Cohnella thailandensis]|uniref:Helix-turn-helix domain-containing protein n=1 Tax=Cohnella thailandensis TaxID=557557 RepID=A0A841SWF3_9BACL|nr:helix-turn-helix domain-containing protein [Cohnella thailandensis]MBB6634435.1 helix-turn-helix domain-containing protein [Cohnella thailandensis]MBP1972065.1 two-component system response regulator YesN [Cohnella thailandensis]